MKNEPWKCFDWTSSGQSYRWAGDAGPQVEDHGWLRAVKGVLHQVSDHVQVHLRVRALNQTQHKQHHTRKSQPGSGPEMAT